MKFSKSVLVFLICIFPATNCAFADSSPNAVALCFADSTTGKDRKDLARWFFSVMALHPEVASMAPISSSDREKSNKAAGLLLNRLLTQSCQKEMKEAANSADPAAMKSAFEQLGRLAMQELMTSPSMAEGFSGITKYLDVQSIKESMRSK